MNYRSSFVIQKKCFEPCCWFERGKKGDIGGKNVIDTRVVCENFGLQRVAQYVDISTGSWIVSNNLIKGAQAYRDGVADTCIHCNQVAGTFCFSNYIRKLWENVLRGLSLEHVLFRTPLAEFRLSNLLLSSRLIRRKRARWYSGRPYKAAWRMKARTTRISSYEYSSPMISLTGRMLSP